MGLRLDPPAHEAVGQMMDPHGVDTNYILKPHVFLFPCGPSNLDSNTQLLLNLAWGCYSGHWVLSLPFQLLYLQADGKKELPRPLMWSYHLLCPVNSEQLWHMSFHGGSFKSWGWPCCVSFASATGSLQCARWWPSVKQDLWCLRSLRCGAHMLLQQNWGCPASDTVTGIWVISSVCWWPWIMNPRAGTRVRSEAFTTDSKM